MYDPEMRKDCPMRGNLGNCSPVGGFCMDAVSDEICEAVHNAYDHGFYNAIKMLKEQEVRELTIDEWREWKNNPKRNPICKLWEHDTCPMWVLNPEAIHEPALLMGKLKLFTGKPTFEQCKAVKWNDD